MFPRQITNTINIKLSLLLCVKYQGQLLNKMSSKSDGRVAGFTYLVPEGPRKIAPPPPYLEVKNY